MGSLSQVHGGSLAKSLPSIAYLTSEYARAGDTFIRREVEELRRQGFQVFTFSIRRNRDAVVSDEVCREQDSTDYILEKNPLQLALYFILQSCCAPGKVWRSWRQSRQMGLPGVKGFFWSLFYVVEAAYLSRRLRELKIQHLHNHIAENSATVAVLASTMAEIPFSLTVHGPREFYVVSQIALDKKIARSKFVACISSFCRSQCMAWSSPSDWPKLHVIHCGLDPRFLDNQPHVVPNPIRFLSVGRLCPEKGQQLLVEAIGRLRDMGMDATLELIGDGPSRPSIEVAIKTLGLEDRIQLLGWKSSDEVVEALSHACVFVLPSFAEGLPVVIMEAMALGRPVISTYVAGIPELVIPGENGWLVPAGDVQALVDAMREALNTPVERLREMGAAGRSRVLERHDIRQEVAKLAGLIQAGDE